MLHHAEDDPHIQRQDQSSHHADQLQQVWIGTALIQNGCPIAIAIKTVTLRLGTQTPKGNVYSVCFRLEKFHY